MQPVPRILTVVLHYGSAAMTRTVVEALRAGLGPQADSSSGTTLDGDIVVLDNAAPDAYAGALRLPQNVFWGGALEQALHMARSGNYTHLWFCNNDIRFLSLARPLIPFVQGRLIYAHKVLGRPVGIWAPAVRRNPYHAQMVQQDRGEFCTVHYVDGIAPLLRLECIDAIGGLDAADNPRGYGLDVWLSMRAHEAGWPVVVDQKLCLRHDYHSTARAVDGFMAQAAADEQRFMCARLGPDWRTVVRARQDIVQNY